MLASSAMGMSTDRRVTIVTGRAGCNKGGYWLNEGCRKYATYAVSCNLVGGHGRTRPFEACASRLNGRHHRPDRQQSWNEPNLETNIMWLPR